MAAKTDKLIQEIMKFHKEKDYKSILKEFHSVMCAENQAQKISLRTVTWPVPTEMDLEILCTFIYSREISNIFSIGCGTGLLEWLLLQMMERKLSLSLQSNGIDDNNYYSHNNKVESATNDIDISINNIETLEYPENVVPSDDNDTNTQKIIQHCLDNNQTNSTEVTEDEEKGIDSGNNDNATCSSPGNEKFKNNTNTSVNNNDEPISNNSTSEVENREINENGPSSLEDSAFESIPEFSDLENPCLPLQLKPVTLTAVEIDSQWWNSTYSPPYFLQHKFADEDFCTKTPFGCHKDLLMFSYFNNMKAFLNYLKLFQGTYILIIGPTAKQYCAPSPLDLTSHPELPCHEWNMILFQRFGLEPVDYIAIYSKAQDFYF